MLSVITVLGMPVLGANLSPTIVPVLLIGTAVLVLFTALIVAVGMHGGPGPVDTAVAYEQAWDRLDFGTLWNLSSARLRDGRPRADFVRDKQQAYQSDETLTRLVRAVRPERVEVNGPVARVFTRLDLADGETVVDEMLLERVGSTWLVTAYHLASSRPDI